MFKLTHYCICLFYFQVGWGGGGWFEVDSTWLIHYKKTDSHPAVLSNSFKFCAPVAFIWFWFFFDWLFPVKIFWVGGGERGSDHTFFPQITFHYFTTIKIINTLVYQSLNSYFFCFLKYESFSNCQQSYYKNIGYLYMWEFTISHANWKICKICEWDGVFT